MEFLNAIQEEISQKLKELHVANYDVSKAIPKNLPASKSPVFQQSSPCDYKTVPSKTNFQFIDTTTHMVKPNPWRKEKIDIKFHKSSDTCKSLESTKNVSFADSFVKSLKENDMFYEVNLARKSLFSMVIPVLLKEGFQFGFQEREVLVICNHIQRNSNLKSGEKSINMESILDATQFHYTKCLQNVLQKFGCQIINAKEEMQRPNMDSTITLDTADAINVCCKSDYIIKEEQNIQRSPDATEVHTTSERNYGIHLDNDMQIEPALLYKTKGRHKVNCLSFCQDYSIPQGNQGYDKNIERVLIADESGQPSDQLIKAVRMKNYIELAKHFKHCRLLHLVTEDKLFTVQQSSLLLQLLVGSNLELKQNFVLFASSSRLPDKERNSFSQHLQSRKKELFSTYHVKYGSSVQGESWEMTINDVAYASLILDLLRCSTRKQVKLDPRPKRKADEEECSTRESTFVLYNFARLSMLHKHFQQEVADGTYPPLPDVTAVDFGLLKEQAEWELFLHYILFYPQLLHNIYCSLSVPNGLRVEPPINKICSFLLQLSHDLSSYYHQTKILLEPRPHLYPLMYARLYLILAIKQIMENAFSLLGISPPTQM